MMVEKPVGLLMVGPIFYSQPLMKMYDLYILLQT